MRTSSYDFSSTDKSHHWFNQDTTTASWDMAHRKQILQLNMTTFIINGTQIDIIGVYFCPVSKFHVGKGRIEHTSGKCSQEVMNLKSLQINFLKSVL